MDLKRPATSSNANAKKKILPEKREDSVGSAPVLVSGNVRSENHSLSNGNEISTAQKIFYKNISSHNFKNPSAVNGDGRANSNSASTSHFLGNGAAFGMINKENNY